MPRRKEITASRQPGAASKAEIFEELIRKVLGVSVRLEAKEIDKKKDSKKEGTMKIYEDSRGWQYSVRPGLSGDTFSVFYRKPGKSWHSVRAVPWYGTAAEAEMALDDYAAKHRMREVTT